MLVSYRYKTIACGKQNDATLSTQMNELGQLGYRLRKKSEPIFAQRGQGGQFEQIGVRFIFEKEQRE